MYREMLERNEDKRQCERKRYDEAFKCSAVVKWVEKAEENYRVGIYLFR